MIADDLRRKIDDEMFNGTLSKTMGEILYKVCQTIDNLENEVDKRVKKT